MAGLSDAASELESIARHLRRAGEFELVRELTRAMHRAVDQVPDEIRVGLSSYLPKEYAYELNPGLRIGVSVRTNERNPGVSINGSPLDKARKLRRTDGGLLTHPVFGDREIWRTQETKRPGWFRGPCEAATPRVRAAIDRALEDVADKATGKGA